MRSILHYKYFNFFFLSLSYFFSYALKLVPNQMFIRFGDGESSIKEDDVVSDFLVLSIDVEHFVKEGTNYDIVSISKV